MEKFRDNIWWKIRRWFRWEAKYVFRNTKEGIKNVIRWMPIIWKDRDWDTHYIWEVLKFKLKSQAKYIGDNDRHMSAKRDAEKMRLCAKLIDKLQNEFYSSEYIDYQNSKFDFVKVEDFPDFPDHYEIKSELLSENFDDYFAKYPRIYKQVIKTEKTLFRKDDKNGIAMNIAHINHDRAKKLLFKIMEREIEKWWD